MSEMISVNKDVLVTLQHQCLVHMTLVANLSQIETLQGTIDMITKMAVSSLPMKEAENIVDVILQNQDDFVSSWSEAITSLKETAQETQVRNPETREEVSPVITE